ncbi:hypothetical protein AVEN_106096-1 [Araneus ventricosus]|uniref:Uncharacterized protein n=1 Tax=Araneus ventricosus TaxID=182803 RepID=A0A4Y2HTX6_ARAVE|nr:hypothetical protein AVEN_106096-1 [Araneus ventricosus]
MPTSGFDILMLASDPSHRNAYLQFKLMKRAVVFPVGSPFVPLRCQILVILVVPLWVGRRCPIAYKFPYPGHNWDQNPGLIAASGNQIYSVKFLFFVLILLNCDEIGTTHKL